jgi:hypothetical protein
MVPGDNDRNECFGYVENKNTDSIRELWHEKSYGVHILPTLALHFFNSPKPFLPSWAPVSRQLSIALLILQAQAILRPETPRFSILSTTRLLSSALTDLLAKVTSITT